MPEGSAARAAGWAARAARPRLPAAAAPLRRREAAAQRSGSAAGRLDRALPCKDRDRRAGPLQPAVSRL